ncbi:unnamed protein product [Medioppia subpectinata]|uniref:Uncharacterized protein n=1 Tax=Medioppia subpectinata TaxID=1979941 RepID=A0A7R9Q597_9ACAR|nr:unnamed protein product [Medioppia subpectinata]CAG2113530.1 unnamed protein product [Medioppia subpectinata]
MLSHDNTITMIDLYVFVAIITIWLLLVIYSTCQHIYTDRLNASRESNGSACVEQNHVLHALSLVSNYRQSIRVNTSHTSSNGNPLDGIRVLCHLSIVLHHFAHSLNANKTSQTVGVFHIVQHKFLSLYVNGG